MRQSVSLVGALVVFGACAERLPDYDITVEDSSGVRIVTNGPAQLASAQLWSLGEQPILNLDPAPDSEHSFHRVNRILPLPEGGLAVLNSGAFEVLVFDSTGALRNRLGRAGDGPGEFRRPNSLLPMLGDSIGVYDGQHRRLSVSSQDGTLGREMTLETVGEGSTGEWLLPFANGDLMVVTNGGFGEEGQEGIYRTESESFSISSDGEKRTSYGKFPGAEIFIGRRSMGAVLFGTITSTATLGNDLIVGTGEAPEIRIFGPDGNLKTVFRWPDRDRVISQERVDAFIEFGLSTLPEAARPQARTMLSDAPRSEQEGVCETILTSSEGHLWVGSPQGPEATYLERPSPPRQWLVFHISGTLLATVETPEGFRPLALEGDRLFGVHVSDLGVESVRVYRVVR